VIVYLDTSSLVKFYIAEEHSVAVTDWIAAAQLHATSRVTLPEAAAALARRQRSGSITPDECTRALADIKDDWPRFAVVDLDEARAADLAVRYGLRGFEAVQLAAAVAVRQEVDEAESLVFSSFDSALNDAARAEGLAVIKPRA